MSELNQQILSLLFTVCQCGTKCAVVNINGHCFIFLCVIIQGYYSHKLKQNQTMR